MAPVHNRHPHPTTTRTTRTPTAPRPVVRQTPPPTAPPVYVPPDVPIYLEEQPPPTLPRPSTTRLIAQPVPLPEPAPRTYDDRLDRVIAEGFGLIFAYLMWFANAVFTIVGLLSLGIPWVIGALIHIGISRWQYTLWHSRFHPLVALLGLIFVLIDLGTTLIGMIQLLRWRFPSFAAGMPSDLSQWGALLHNPAPPWGWQAVLLVALTLLLAFGSEYLIRVFWQRFTEAWYLFRL